MNSIQLKEELNKLDRKALDEDLQYFDLLNLYEAMKPLSNDEQKALNDAVKTKNPELINAAMDKITTDRNPAVKNKIDQLTAKVTDEAVEYDEYNLYKLCEEEQLEEDKIVPEKCFAKSSGKPYYSLKNVTDDQHVCYKARTHYNTLQAATDKLSDLKGHVDGEYISKDNVIMTDRKEDESLELNEGVYVHFDKEDPSEDKEYRRLSDAQKAIAASDKPAELYHLDQNGEKEILWVSNEDNTDEKSETNPLVSVSDGLKAEVYQMLKKPVNVSGANAGEPKPRIWLLIKLYQMTNQGTPNVCVLRSDLLVASGNAKERKDIDTQQQTWFEELGPRGRYDHGNKILGDNLLNYSGKEVWPTANLKPFIEGQNQFNIDFTKFIGTPRDPEVSGLNRKAQDQDNPLKSRAGQTYTPKNQMASDTPEQAQARMNDENKFNTVSTGWRRKASAQESLVTPTEFSDNSRETRLNKIREEKVAALRKAYREEYGLNEEVEITEADFGCDKLKKFCWKNNLSWDYAREALLGDK